MSIFDYNSSFRCSGCSRSCDLTAPSCPIGKQRAKQEGIEPVKKAAPSADEITTALENALNFGED